MGAEPTGPSCLGRCVTQQAFDLGQRPIWSQVPIEYPPAVELADRHYSRQTIGSSGIVPPGRRILLWHETTIGAAVWSACLNKDPVGTLRWRNTIFRNESGTLSSTLIVAATEQTYDVWRRRYRELPGVPLTTEIAIELTRRRRSKRHEPGHCYRIAGWVEIRRSQPPFHGRPPVAVLEAPPCLT